MDDSQPRKPHNRFSRSFLPEVRLKKGKPCHWKKHFRNVLREVIGYFESLRSVREKRFVFASVQNIADHGNQYRRGKTPYKKRQIEYALQELERLGIIARVDRVKVRGRIYRGFLVLPHASACRAVDGYCHFEGAWDRVGWGRKKTFFFNADGELDMEPEPWPE